MRIPILVVPAIVVVAVAGCFGPPKPRPELAPPPVLEELPVEPASAAEPGPVAESEPEPVVDPKPEPAPVVPTPKMPETRDLIGWWMSEGAQGPGSASVRRIDLIFNPDGTYEGLAVIENDGHRARLDRGRYEQEEDEVQIRYDDGRVRSLQLEWIDGRLTLREDGAELVLKRVIPVRIGR